MAADPNRQSTRCAPWRARVWDHPSNGTRYYVTRGDGEADYLTDDRGGVMTLHSRKIAEQLADQENQKEAAHDQ